MSQHSKYSPSRLARIIACPGSVSLCAKSAEQEQTSYAAEGSMLHLATERALDTVRMGDYCPVDIVSPPLNKEQRRAVQDCLEYAWAIERRAAIIDPQYTSTIEQQVTLAKFDQPEVYGTMDFSVEAKGELDVVDWKFGKGIEVCAEDNDQLYAYALGRLISPKKLQGYHTIRIHVYQPQMGNESMVELKPADLLRWLNHSLAPALDNALQKNPTFCPGEKQCRWCDAKNACEYRLSMAQNLASEVFAVHAKLPKVVDMNALSKLLGHAKLLTGYLADLKSYAMNQIKVGKEFPGYKVVAGRSIRGWKDPEDALIYLSTVVDDTELYTKKFVSPAQAEKLIGRNGSKETQFQSLIEKPEGKPTLVAESDRRPALPISAENVFSKMVK